MTVLISYILLSTLTNLFVVRKEDNNVFYLSLWYSGGTWDPLDIKHMYTKCIIILLMLFGLTPEQK